jgi:cytochrome c553
MSQSIHRFVLLILASIAASASSAGGDKNLGEQKATACIACHGPAGNSMNPVWPKLAGQHESYVVKQLMDFKSQGRTNALMSGQAANLSDQDMADLAAYFSQQPVSGGVAVQDKIARGERIYRGGIAEAGVPACMGCHGPSGAGNPPAKFPRLGGQHAAYTAAQLKAYRSGERANDGDVKTMRSITARMSDQDIEAVAEYVAGLH